MRGLRPLSVILVLLAASASCSQAAASVTIGQVAPGGPPSPICGSSPYDMIQPTVNSGNTYVVPFAGTITSWTHNGAVGAGQQLTMKVFRKTGEPNRWQAVGHDGPRDLPAAGGLVTFPAAIPVKPGDVLGANDANATSVSNACSFAASGEVHLEAAGDLSDGASTDFAAVPPGARVNVQASLAPTNEFSFGETKRNKKKGTATLTVTFPNPGVLLISGAKQFGATVAGPNSTRPIAGPGPVNINLRATGKKRKALDNNGRVRIPLEFTFTPTGGDSLSKPKGLKLRKLRP